MKTDPVIFQVGDIVEVQMTIEAVQTKTGKHNMIYQLRSIALLDDSHSQVGDMNIAFKRFNNFY
jgi:hypothetical protein